MAANTIPTVSTLPPAPTRADAPADFTTKADTFVAALPKLVTQVNLTVSGMNDQASYLDQLKTDVNGYKNAAAQSATDAATQAGNAKTYADNAMTYRDSAQSAAAAAQAAAGLPAISGKADFMLSVNAAGNGIEYRASVPRPSSSMAGKVPKVNSSGNGYELADASPLSKYFESAQQTVVADGYNTVTHGFGVPPKFISAYLLCTSAIGGYAVGDRIEVSVSSIYAIISGGGTPIPSMIQVSADQATIFIKQTANMTLPNKSSASSSSNRVGVTSANFSLVVRAAA